MPPDGNALGIPTANSIDDLRAIPTVPTPQRHSVFVRTEGDVFSWDPSSSETDDGDTIVKPTDRAIMGGRWVGSGPGAAIGPVAAPRLLVRPDLYFYAGAGVVRSGDSVDSWTDQIRRLAVSQSSTRRPTFASSVPGLGGRPALKFNQDSYQNLVAAAGTLSSVDADHTVIAVMLPTYCHQAFGATARTTRQYFIQPTNDAGAGDTERLILAYKANLNSPRYGYFDEAGASSGWNHAIHQSMNKPQVFTWDLKSGAASLRRNGVVLSSGLAYTRRKWQNGLTIGSAYNQGAGSVDTFFDGYVAAIYVKVNGLTTAEIAAQEAEFMETFGIPLWDDAPLLIAPEVWHRSDMGHNVNELRVFDEWHNAGGVSGVTAAFALRPGTAAAPPDAERPGTTVINGKTALTFDGVAQYMTGGQYTYQWSRCQDADSRHGWFVGRVNSISTDAAAGSPHLNDHILADSAGNFGLALDATDGAQNYGFAGPAKAVASLAGLLGQLVLIEWWYDGANLKIQVNGGAIVTGDALATQGGSAAVSIHLGRRGGHSEYAHIDVLEWGMKQAFGGANSTILRSYVASHYGIAT
jgi:hypothetical protein